MSTKKEAYLCLSAMLRAREPRLLNAERAGRMLDASGFEEAAKLLCDCGYEDMSQYSAADIDRALTEHRNGIFDELCRLCPDKALPELFRLRYDYHNAKTLLKAEAMGTDPDRLLSGSGRLRPEKLKESYREERYSELGELGRTMKQAKELLSRTGNPQLADFELDRSYFAEMKALAEGLDNRFVSGYVRLLIDSANLRSLVRTVRMGKNSDFLESVLIPGGTDCDRLSAADGETLSALYTHTPLEEAAVLGAEAMNGGTMTAFERACDNAVSRYLKGAKLIAYGPEAVVAYLFAVENEITALRMILTGRLAGVSAAQIRERMRELYA